MKAVYPGSFDPLTIGHLDIIKRASKLFSELHILVSYNMFKKTSFTVDERIQMLKDTCCNIPNVIIDSYDGLVVNYAKENNIDVIIRGMRNYSDYEAEFSLFQFNREIYPKIDTVLMMPTSKNQMISSSAIKELVKFDVDISKYVPKEIKERIVERFKNN